MLLAVLMVVLMYLLPTMAALGVTTDTSEWSMGFYGRVADQVGLLRSQGDGWLLNGMTGI